MNYKFIAFVLVCSTQQATAYKFYIQNETADNLDVKLIFTSSVLNTQRRTWAVNAGEMSGAIQVGGYRCLERVQVKQHDDRESAYQDIDVKIPAGYKGTKFKTCDDSAVIITGEKDNYRWEARPQ